MSAEVPKLHRRLPLGDPYFNGDRPPAEVVVVLADPAVLPPSPARRKTDRALPLDDHAMAFPALSRFDFV
jgi:hypothetical protein